MHNEVKWFAEGHVEVDLGAEFRALGFLSNVFAHEKFFGPKDPFITLVFQLGWNDTLAVEISIITPVYLYTFLHNSVFIELSFGLMKEFF